MTDSTIQYIIAIDAGGSKTVARLVNLKSNISEDVTGGSGSLTNNTLAACNTIRSLIDDLLKCHGCESSQTIVIIGAAGAENDSNKAQLTSALADLGLAKIIIKSDAFISLLGATNGEPGVVVALGTGSVAMRLDEEDRITQFGGWGFRVGDQGSGAQLGRALVTAVLQEFDRGHLASPLVSNTLDIIGRDRQAILRWVKAATPRDFASLCPLVVTDDDTDPLAGRLIEQTLSDIDSLIHLARGDTSLPVYLMGGLGKAIYDYLPLAKESWVDLARGDAVDGALLIGRRFLIQND